MTREAARYLKAVSRRRLLGARRALAKAIADGRGYEVIGPIQDRYEAARLEWDTAAGYTGV